MDWILFNEVAVAVAVPVLDDTADVRRAKSAVTFEAFLPYTLGAAGRRRNGVPVSDILSQTEWPERENGTSDEHRRAIVGGDWGKRTAKIAAEYVQGLTDTSPGIGTISAPCCFQSPLVVSFSSKLIGIVH